MDSQRTPPAQAGKLSQAEEAVVYAYPLYEMARMRADTSPRRLETGDALPPPQRWCNVFTHTRRLIGPGQSRVVTPNNDTLYTTAWLDLGAGPLVIDVPDTAGRYYVLGLLDQWTNPFAHLGQRLTGTGARAFLVTGPGWQGEVPAEFQAPGAQVTSPTRWVWVIGRILVDGEADLPAVRALQDAMHIRSLADWQAGRRGRPLAFDPGCDPRAELSAAHFARQVNAGLAETPALPADQQDERLQAALAAAGLGAGRPVPEGAVLERLQQALDQALPRLRAHEAGRRTGTGWLQFPLVSGSFGRDHEFRALVALKYIGMLESREASYALAVNDAEGQPLQGRHRYRMRFAPNALPEVQAFWSLTMYDSADCMLVANPIDRYAIGDRTPGLQPDADGGLTIHIAHQPPESPAHTCNWLPAPAGDFYLCLRLYLPSEAVLDGRRPLPALERCDAEGQPLPPASNVAEAGA